METRRLFSGEATGHCVRLPDWRYPVVCQAAMFGRALHVTVEDAEAGPALIREVLGAVACTVSDVHPVEPSLEDVFVSLVRAEGGARVG